MNAKLAAILLFVLSSHALAQWKFVNPRPFTYNLLTSCFRSDSVGWVAGQDGIIHKTTDGGKSWVRQDTHLPETHSIESMSFVDDSTGWAVALVGHILKTTDGGAHWVEQTSGTRNYLYAVSFVSKDTGYAFGEYGMCLKTTDGGETWNITSVASNLIYGCQFLTGQLGYVAGSSGLLKTTDGGRTWNVSYAVDNVHGLNSVSFLDSLKGWAAGDGGTIIKTVDGGRTWNEIGFHNWIPLRSIAFKNDSVGCVLSANDIFRTTDGGATWQKDSTRQYFDLTNVTFRGNGAYVVGWWGGMYRSDDEGQTWRSLDTSLTSSELRWGCFSDPKHGWIAASSQFCGTILNTTDGGENWNVQLLDSTAWYYSISFTDSLFGMACGTRHSIIRTTDGGAHWIHIDIDTLIKDVRSIVLIDRQKGFCCGYGYNRNRLYKTTDGGLTWSRIKSIEKGNYGSYYLFFKDSLNGWVTADSLYRTTDGGETWTGQKIDLANSVSQMTFCDSLHGYALSQWDFLRTSDGGATWSKTRLTEYLSNSFYFINSNEGWRAGANGTVYHTLNGGISWTLETMSSPYLNFITGKGSTLVAGGSMGTIIRRTIDGVTSVGEGHTPVTVTEYRLDQNYPNPFNPSTMISFSLPQRSFVTLKVYDLMGREIATIASGELPAGLHSRQWNGAGHASGVYFYRLQAGSFSQTKKLILLR